ncbi:MAG TPA: amidohydrolase family protein [Candidatus Acidoferrales bacterium]|jgi:imidazolonepropionase-like amidohydrolase|nr:amidohydrolase family protein [Candidatus Acidoferrales bacterium]
MKPTRTPILIALVALLAAGFVTAHAVLAQSQPSYAITGAKVFPISGPPMDGATIIIRDGKISAVGKGVAIPSGAKVIDAKGLEVYPGMFNAITEMGINEVGEGAPGSVDTAELGEYNPQLVTASAVNPASAHIDVTRADGITHVISAMGAGGGRGGGGSVIPGQASLFNLAGWTMDEMQIRRSAAMTVNWPAVPGGAAAGGRGGGGFPAAGAAGGNTQADYNRRVADLAEWLDRARHYAQAMQSKSDAPRDLKLEALVPVIKGDLPLFVMANQANQIREAVAFCDKQKVKLIIATGTAAGEVKDLLKEKNVPVVLRPTLTLVRSEDEPYDLSLALAGELSKAGVKIAFGSFGNEFARRLSQQAGNSVAYGLSHDEAMKALTIYPAEMFGVSKELGTIEVGKMANLIITNGDPLEITTEVRYLFIRGVQTSTDNRHKQLYEEYRKRP